ncbi:hypothetical protein D915_001986 [Fasciola hepatica]|uniref:Uncharacterized protein n=1 Tax=Fasciola hepatica TaxID=6192 RepID=A0A4E0S246_FASHE|nr:hypothetical protein D915_001986 [Fasciola hepatica]
MSESNKKTQEKVNNYTKIVNRAMMQSQKALNITRKVPRKTYEEITVLLRVYTRTLKKTMSQSKSVLKHLKCPVESKRPEAFRNRLEKARAEARKAMMEKQNLARIEAQKGRIAG